MSRRRDEDEPRAFDYEPDHFEPYRMYDPARGEDDEEDEAEEHGPSHGIIAGPDEDIDADLLEREHDLHEPLADLARCPHCNEELFWQSVRCPACGDWITPMRRRGGVPAWRYFQRSFVVLIVILLIIAAAFYWR